MSEEVRHDLPAGGAPSAGVRANVFERRVQRTDPVRLAGDKGVNRDRHDAGDRFAASRPAWSSSAIPSGSGRPAKASSVTRRTWPPGYRSLTQGGGIAFAALAQREGVSRSYFTRLVGLSYLAPDITQAILDGRQPRDLTPEKLLEHSRLPLAWHDQRIVLGLG
jgi:hypothetical protein